MIRFFFFTRYKITQGTVLSQVHLAMTPIHHSHIFFNTSHSLQREVLNTHIQKYLKFEPHSQEVINLGLGGLREREFSRDSGVW